MDNPLLKKELYRTEVPKTKSAGQTLILIFIAAIVIMLVFSIAQFLPAAWFFEICAIAFCAVYMNKLLKEGTFKKTYILYEDSLVVVTKYGLIERVTEEYILDKSEFTDKTVTFNGKTSPFYPDNELKRLLNI